MYCSHCESYIPGGLSLSQCPSCEVDIVTVALPVDRKRPLVLDFPLPPPVPKVRVRERVKPESDFNVFQAFFYSFFSAHFYRDVARKWKGACLVYMTLLSAVAGFPMAASFVTQYSEVQNEHIFPILRRFPSIGIESGRLIMVEPSPYILRDNKNQLNLAIFDTAGQTTSLNQIPGIFLFTKDHIVSRESSMQERMTPYPAAAKLKINNEILYFAASQIERWMSFMVFPMMCAAASLIFLVLGVLYSVPGIIFSSFCKANLDYGAVYRLSVVAMTPATILSGLLTLLVQDLDERMGFFYLLTFGFLAYAIWSIRQQDKKEEAKVNALEIEKRKKRDIFI